MDLYLEIKAVLDSCDRVEKGRLHFHKAKCTCPQSVLIGRKLTYQGFSRAVPRGSSFVLINIQKTFSDL